MNLQQFAIKRNGLLLLLLLDISHGSSSLLLPCSSSPNLLFSASLCVRNVYQASFVRPRKEDGYTEHLSASNLACKLCLSIFLQSVARLFRSASSAGFPSRRTKNHKDFEATFGTRFVSLPCWGIPRPLPDTLWEPLATELGGEKAGVRKKKGGGGSRSREKRGALVGRVWLRKRQFCVAY